MRRVPDLEARHAVPDLLHRLRNPLAALNSGISLMMHVARPTGETLELLKQMLGEVCRLDATTRETQRYFSMTAGHPEPVPVAEAAGAARAAVREVAARAGVELVLEGSAEERVVIDPEQLRFCLAELLANAVRLSLPGGQVRVAWHRGRTHLERIEVQDSGKGIPDSYADEIGRPYFTTSPERTGLGLATVARICRLAGGKLRWDNVSGGGCRFLLEIPVG
ncbi:MAG: HAMP domain-containing histidine kinase [Acidobacteriia bacterium]|nr:HAMP domain-containing histidine kinase [Terriglobia bacterium]